MPRRRKTKKQLLEHVGVTVLIAVIFIGTFLVIFSSSPEEVRVVSDDGVLTVEGVAQAGIEMSIKQEESGMPLSVVISPLYTITVQGGGISEADIIVSPNSEWGSLIEDLIVYVYDFSHASWVPVSTRVDFENQQLRSTTKLWGSTIISIGTLQDYAITNSSHKLLDSVLNSAPDNAISYTAELYFASQLGDFVLINSSLDQGGCAGKFLSGRDTHVVMQEQSINEGTERVRVVWVLGDGCGEGAQMRSSGMRK